MKKLKKLKTNSNSFKTAMKTLLGILILLQTTSAFGQNIYVKTFGDSSSTPIIYLHGGPGYNCSIFEITTAQKLADNGYYVVAYDRRGEGRSGEIAEFTFEQTHSDLVGIMDSLHIKSANLIGHSFGGMVAIKFAEKHQARVQSIILVGAPVSLQESFKTIITSCEKIYEDSNNETNLSYIKMLKAMDSNSIEYSTYCFMHAMQNGFYSPKKPTEEAQSIYELFKTDSTLINNAAKMGYKQPQGFWKNEAYTTMDLSMNIETLKKKKVKIYGMYGKEDGLYSPKQIDDLKSILGKENIYYIKNCSHSVFIDQQKIFIDGLNKWIK
jgi:proline iminopeptidase